MATKVSARSFHYSTGVSEWRVCDGGASAWFVAPDLATALDFGAEIAALPECVHHPPDLDVRSVGVMVRLSTFMPGPDGLSELDVSAAQAISRLARGRGMVADPSRIGNMVLNVGSTSPSTVLPFWRAVLGVEEVDGELNDPLARQPVVCFQDLEQERPGHGRIHVDVWVPHDQAEARVAAGLAAGGVLVSDARAPSWWILADPDGNEACVATWIGTDGQGWPT